MADIAQSRVKLAPARAAKAGIVAEYAAGADSLNYWSIPIHQLRISHTD